MTDFLRDNAVTRYLRETWAELKKVRWPTRKEATNLTMVVLVVMIGMAVLLWLIDTVFSFELGLVISGDSVAIAAGIVVTVVGLIALVVALRREE